MINHIRYHDFKGYEPLEEVYKKFGAINMPWRINTRTHGDTSDSFVELMGSIRTMRIFDENFFKNKPSSINLVGQPHPTPVDGAFGYYLDIPAIYPFITQTYIFLGVSEDDYEIANEIMNKVCPPGHDRFFDKIVGVWEMLDAEFY